MMIYMITKRNISPWWSRETLHSLWWPVETLHPGDHPLYRRLPICRE